MFQYPLENVWPVTQEFGDNPGSYGRFGMVAHNGIDFGCPVGTNVLACGGGVVEHADYDDCGYGWYVQVRHVDGLVSVYGHLSQVRTQSQVTVKMGQVIGRSGSSGNSTGPHLHMEIRRDGESRNGYRGAVDPRGVVAWPGPPAPVPGAPAPVPGAPAVKYIVNATQLNVRTGPGMKHGIVGLLHFGDELQVVEVAGVEAWGRLADGRWVALVYGGFVLAEKG